MGRASNNGKIIGSTTQTLPQPTNSTVRIASTTNLPLIQGQIQPFTNSNIMKSSNQIPNPLPINHYPHPSEDLSNNNNTLITTTNVILDYLLYVSINARIDQTKNELKDDQQQQSSTFHTKKGQGVEAIVEGLLQSHRTQASSVLLPLPLKHRLYLCQLLHLVFDRSHIASSGSSSSSSSQITQNLSNTANLSKSNQFINNNTSINTSNLTTTTTTMSPSSSPSRNNSTQKPHKLPSNLVKYEKHFKNALLSRCRKHRKSICTACQQHFSNSSITPPMTRRRSTPPKPIPTRRNAPGLIDAIPVFLNTCAITYRLDHNNESTVKPIWYDLLLDLLTQAAIECYLCDSYSSIDALLEIFSYGNIDPSDYHSDDDSESDDDDPHFAATRADDYLLWQRTAYLDEFRQKKKDRMEEFLNVKGKLEQHFENLANKYPIRKFETDMLNYCADVTESLEPPALTTKNKNDELSNDLFHIPGRYDGGIDIPMSDDEYIEDIRNPSQYQNNNTDGKKRRLSEADKFNESTKKNKNEEILSFQQS
ncbi:hypothetical protein RclHR1_21390001 [Rhizophagus clarus]|uniref:Uncharacterized protein n=1 Tax=Rhizophagus clarus TaxID=94130 RepID=A0A2Z6RLP9_9GLOM|nr:hypothetical protein RclHR1_21390001 [Rhizophagus clarus]